MTFVCPHKKRSRRLRKKLHLGEFQEFGYHLSFHLHLEQMTLNEAVDRWIEFVESRGWAFGGGSLDGLGIAGYLSQFDSGTLTEQDRAASEEWLAAQPWVASHQVAPLSDAWYGPWPESP